MNRLAHVPGIERPTMNAEPLLKLYEAGWRDGAAEERKRFAQELREKIEQKMFVNTAGVLDLLMQVEGKTNE